MSKAANADEFVVNDTDEELENDGLVDLQVIDDDDSFDSGSTFGGTEKQTQDDSYQTNQELETLRRERDEANQRASEREAELEKERLEKRKLGKAFVETHKTNLDREIESLETQLISAKEDGDSKSEVQLEGKLAKARAEAAKLEVALGNIDDEPATPPAKKPEQRTAPSSDEQRDARAAQDWVARNKWFAAPEKEADMFRKNRALRINEELMREGRLDNKSPEFYKEVDRRLAMEEKQNGGRRSNVAGVNNSAAGGSTGGKGAPVQVRITPEEKAMLRELKINPDDPKMRQAYAREKIKVDNRWRDDEPNNPQTL